RAPPRSSTATNPPCSTTIPPPPRSPLFPYTTLFRSRSGAHARGGGEDGDARAPTLHAPGDRRQPRADRALRLRAPGRQEREGLRSEEHTSELQSRENLVCRLLLEKKENRFQLPSQRA